MSDLNDLIPISSVPNLNKGLSSPNVQTMTNALGRPREPLVNNDCRNDQASPVVKRLLETRRMTPKFRLTGIKPALDSVQGVLAKVKEAHPDLIEQLSTEGMTCVRHKNPPHGPPSDEPSNHSWGTAIDFKLIGHNAPKNTRPNVPQWVAMMIPFFNEAGWFSGIAFDDAMHFEVATETLHRWKEQGLLPEVAPEDKIVVAGGGGWGQYFQAGDRLFRTLVRQRLSPCYMSRRNF
jgi:hypothetical protein